MAAKQELQVQQKREIENKPEATTPARMFVPAADIYENQDALTLILEMPGVDREHIDLRVEDGVLSVTGNVDFEKYKGLQPLYTDTMWATIKEASAFQARLIKARSKPS